jgi:hypothetical protein
MDNKRNIFTVQLAIVVILVALVSCEMLVLHSEWFGGEQQDVTAVR